MIPLRDHSKTETTPIITYLILVINVLVFGYMLLLSGSQLSSFIETFAFIPNNLVEGRNLHQLITSMFLHGGFGHIIGNMVFLHVFGDNLEDKLGHFKYLLFYLFAGLAATGLQFITDPTSTIPNLGASGAIAGLLGGYLVLFPHHRVDILVPLGGFIRTATVPAFTMLIYWILYQFILGFGSLGVTGGGVAYFAHIGGFIAGVVVLGVFRIFNKR